MFEYKDSEIYITYFTNSKRQTFYHSGDYCDISLRLILSLNVSLIVSFKSHLGSYHYLLLENPYLLSLEAISRACSGYPKGGSVLEVLS